MTTPDTIPLTGSEQTVLAIYAVMLRDWSDALDMLNECTDRAVLETLLGMLKRPDTSR
jgi:hypothetical protein